MIAFAKPEFTPSEDQKKVKKILEKVTGLGVRVIPFQPPVTGMPATVSYVFKCGYDQSADKSEQAAQIHACHDYIKNFVMGIGNLGYDKVAVELIGRVDGHNDDMYPWTSVRFANVMGFPATDREALQSAKEMERNIMEHIQDQGTRLSLYQEQRMRSVQEFKDGFSDQLGK